MLTHTKEELTQKVEELRDLYMESRRLVKNLILAGDHFNEFEERFGESTMQLQDTSEELVGTSEDLKQTAQVLSEMVNSLAQQVPSEKQHLVEKSNLTKFQNLVHKVIQQPNPGES